MGGIVSMLTDRREEGSPSGRRPGPKAGALTLAALSTLKNFRSVMRPLVAEMSL